MHLVIYLSRSSCFFQKRGGTAAKCFGPDFSDELSRSYNCSPKISLLLYLVDMRPFAPAGPQGTQGGPEARVPQDGGEAMVPDKAPVRGGRRVVDFSKLETVPRKIGILAPC